MLKIKDIELKLQLEKMVIGLSEPILIKGAGKFLAKVDSGNGGYNVIHGEDFVRQGDILNFKTIDETGAERRISKKIKDTLNVHIGGGNIQERPVVELDIKFADEDYKKIPFSVTDRSANKEKVLISKDFIQNELDALIDVSQTNMTENEPVEVDYVTEGFLKSKNGEASVLRRVAKHPLKAAGSGIEKLTKVFHTIGHGVDSFSDFLPTHRINGTKTGSEKADKSISELPQLIKNDSTLIKNKLQQEMPQIAQAVSPNRDPNTQQEINFEICRVIDYTNYIMYGEVLEIENSLMYKNLDELAGIKKENSTQETPATTDKNKELVTASYFDKWMARYEYLTERERNITLKRNGKNINVTTNGNTLLIPAQTDKSGKKHFYRVQMDKVHGGKDGDFIKRAQSAYTNFINKKRIYKANMAKEIAKANKKFELDKKEETPTVDSKEDDVETKLPDVEPAPDAKPTPQTDEQPAAESDKETATQDTAPQTGDQAAQQKRQELENKLNAELKAKNQFCLYFCGSIDQNAIMDMFKSIESQYKSKSKAFLNNMSFNDAAFEAYMLQLKQDLLTTNVYKNGCCGLYALCTGRLGSRNVKLFYNTTAVIPLQK